MLEFKCSFLICFIWNNFNCSAADRYMKCNQMSMSDCFKISLSLNLWAFYTCTHVSTCFCTASHMLGYWSSQCKTKWLEPGGMWHQASSISASFILHSKICPHGTFAVKWSKAVICSLPTEHAAATTLTTGCRFPCSLYGTLSETDNALWQHTEEKWQQWRQGCDCVRAWHVAMLIVSSSSVYVMLMLCCCLQSIQWMSRSIADIRHE